MPSSTPDGCCPVGANANTDADCSVACGNGAVEQGETCDPASACPQECKSTNACLVPALTGATSSCNVTCEMTSIAACKGGDGCCPAGCNYGSDNDCSKSCGDGQVTAPETCEPTSATQPCAASCDDGKACTTDVKTGSAAQCNVVCTSTPITAPAHGDGCCPAGANALNDNDCKPACGNGVKEGAELCDGADCPTSCDDRNPCTDDALAGSTASCDAKCGHTAKSSSGTVSDGCCLPGDNNTRDADCAPACGNGVIEAGETCDGNCRANCDDGNGCTNDVQTGSPQQCNIACQNPPSSGLCSGGTCVNAAGSYTCNCNTGYVGTGTQTCTKTRYIVSADTVTDNDLNIVWQRVVPSSFAGCSAGVACTWLEANNYCNNLVLAGSSSWRLPSLDELQSILVGSVAPMVDMTLFPNTPAEYYWTSTTYDNGDPTVFGLWVISFATGTSTVKSDARVYYVRCVR
jgi:hypothetical protein